MSDDTIHGLGFPESLRWRDGALWWSDMFRSRVQRRRPGGAVETVLDRGGGAPTQPGGLGWLPDGTLLVVDCLERRVLAVRPGEATAHVHADLADRIEHPANDLHVDADGTAWVGSYGFDPERDEPRSVPLLRVARDGSIEPTARTFVFPNGMERDAQGRLVVAETFADRLTVLSPDEAATTTVALEPGSGPDGLSIGPDGTIHVALAFVGAVVAVTPARAGATDAVIRVVHRPAAIADGPAAGPVGAYDCALSPDGRRLAVAVASGDEVLALRHDTGRIEFVDLPGAPA